MDRSYVSGSSRPLPVIDNGERERLSFWRRHTAVIQSDLLEITGWLSHAGDRKVPTETDVGLRFVPAGSRPPNVLFLVPREGTKGRQNWEWCLNYLRVEQNRRLVVQQQIDGTDTLLKRADAELKVLETRYEEVDSRLRAMAEKARRGVERGSRPSSRGPLTQFRLGMDGARESLTAYRVAERHRDTISLRLEGFRDHLVPRVYVGLWARINAFLDLQALSVANVASEEFRKVPRPLARLATRLERELEED